jgi:hypothetical protein
VDPSAFIFVGLALAWAAYLIPKALEHHDAGARSRTVEKFSHTMRVIARREAVDRRKTRLVTSRTSSGHAAVPEPIRSSSSSAASTSAATAAPPSAPEPDAEETGFFSAQTFVRRSASSQAARRRRRVLAVLLVLAAMVGAISAGRVISWWWVAAPVALLVGWLVACRLMVKSERAARRRVVPRTAATAAPATPEPADAADPYIAEETAELLAVRAAVAEAEPIASGDGWELVPVTLPTYVSKPAAPRTVSTIDLDSTGVWTSGHTTADSALAQQADAIRAGGAQAPREQQQRVGGA